MNIKIGSLKAKWRRNWPPTWQLKVARMMMDEWEIAMKENRPLCILF